MNKISKKILSPVFLAILSTTVYAEDIPVQTHEVTTESTSTATTVNPTPATSTTTSTQPMATVTTTPKTSVIDCNMHIPKSQTTIDSSLITNWTTRATLQSFNFSPAAVDTQLDDLKACFTEAGWKGFNEALQKSGNINAIKNQQLSVSSQEDGPATINMVKDNQWKVSLPIQVVYQSAKERVTQHLNVDVIVGRKATGDLGILQMVATTRNVEVPTATTTTPVTTTPVTTTTAPATTTTTTTTQSTTSTDNPPPATTTVIEH